MPGDVIDQGWVYQHAKEHVLIPSHLVEMSKRLLVSSNVPKAVHVSQLFAESITKLQYVRCTFRGRFMIDDLR